MKKQRALDLEAESYVLHHHKASINARASVW